MRASLVTSVLCGVLLLAGSGCTGDPAPGASAAASAATVNGLIGLGISQAQQGEYARAEATFRQVLDLDGTNKYAWFNLGYLSQVQRKNDEALVRYDKAITTDPSFTQAMFNKAIILEPQQPQSAIGLYQTILTINPKASTTYARLGLTLLQQGDRAGAAKNFAQALKLDPGLRGSIPPEFGGAGPSRPS